MTTTSHVGGPEGDTLRPVRRAVAGPLLAFVTCVAGLLGLVVGVMPTAPAGEPSGATGAGVAAGSIRVFGAYVREPASPDVAAAYLSVANDGTQADTLLSVSSGAAQTVTLHDVPDPDPGQTPDPGQVQPGTEDMTATGPLTIPGGSTVTLAPTRGHLMMEGLLGPLRPGDRVSLLLTFKRAGQVLVSAPVVPIAAPAPTQGGDR